MEVLLAARQKLREQFTVLHERLLSIVKGDAVCRRLMTVPGVGPVVALAFKVRSTFLPASRIRRP